MALFGKKDPCAICGGPVKGLLPHKIEKQLVCRDCYGTVDLPDDVIGEITLKDFKAYMAFRDQNALIKSRFTATHTIDLGLFSSKIVVDTNNRLFCMDKDLEKTIFEGKDIVSFAIKEDSFMLFEGRANGLKSFPSSVRECIMSLTPQINRMNMHQNLQNISSAFGVEKENRTNSTPLEIPEPFAKFNIEIYVNHPYWRTITAQMSAPGINNDRPDLNEYLREYTESALLMEELANSLTEIAFPAAQNQTSESTIASAQTDAVGEIRRYKELFDQGIITEDEFNAKKRQLLGI